MEKQVSARVNVPLITHGSLSGPSRATDSNPSLHKIQICCKTTVRHPRGRAQPGLWRGKGKSFRLHDIGNRTKLNSTRRAPPTSADLRYDDITTIIPNLDRRTPSRDFPGVTMQTGQQSCGRGREGRTACKVLSATQAGDVAAVQTTTGWPGTVDWALHPSLTRHSSKIICRLPGL
jgi:hypothetical protein